MSLRVPEHLRVEACPECESSDIYERSWYDGEEPWICYACDSWFLEPIERTSFNTSF